MQCFAEKGVICAKCGLVGTFFALEIFKSCAKPHFNLYGFNAAGEEILLTMDHVRPKAQGGTNNLDNAQTLCGPCNFAKGCRFPDEDRAEIDKRLKDARDEKTAKRRQTQSEEPVSESQA